MYQFLIIKSNLDALCNPLFCVQLGFLRAQRTGLLHDPYSRSRDPRQPSENNRLAPFFLSFSPVREDECEAKRKAGKWIREQNGESHLLLLTTEYSQTRDKEIPFVGKGPLSSFSGINPLTEQVSPQVNGGDNAALMLVGENMCNGILSLWEHGYLCNMEMNLGRWHAAQRQWCQI